MRVYTIILAIVLFNCSPEQTEKKHSTDNRYLSIQLTSRSQEITDFRESFKMSEDQDVNSQHFSNIRTLGYIDSLTNIKFSNQPKLTIYIKPMFPNQIDSLTIYWSKFYGEDSVIYSQVFKEDGHRSEQIILDKLDLKGNLKFNFGNEYLGQLSLSQMYNYLVITQFEKVSIDAHYSFKKPNF